LWRESVKKVKNMTIKRKQIPPKIKLIVFKRDNYTCKLCGRTPALNPGISLDVDHIFPHSKGGLIELDNLQTSCSSCNRSKGNDEELNKTIRNEIDAILNEINPRILDELNKTKNVKVVANDFDFSKLKQLNELCNYYEINIIPNSINGYQACYNMGIYTVKDNYGSKINFYIIKLNNE